MDPTIQEAETWSGRDLASPMSRYPWKFPEGWISQDVQISNGISRNLGKAQRTRERYGRHPLVMRLTGEPQHAPSHAAQVPPLLMEQFTGEVVSESTPVTESPKSMPPTCP